MLYTSSEVTRTRYDVRWAPTAGPVIFEYHHVAFQQWSQESVPFDHEMRPTLGVRVTDSLALLWQHASTGEAGWYESRSWNATAARYSDGGAIVEAFWLWEYDWPTREIRQNSLLGRFGLRGSWSWAGDRWRFQVRGEHRKIEAVLGLSIRGHLVGLRFFSGKGENLTDLSRRESWVGVTVGS